MTTIETIPEIRNKSDFAILKPVQKVKIGKKDNCYYVGSMSEWGWSCGGCLESNPIVVREEDGKIIEEKVLTLNLDSKNLIRGVSSTRTITSSDENYQNYKQILGVKE